LYAPVAFATTSVAAIVGAGVGTAGAVDDVASGVTDGAAATSVVVLDDVCGGTTSFVSSGGVAFAATFPAEGALASGFGTDAGTDAAAVAAVTVAPGGGAAACSGSRSIAAGDAALATGAVAGATICGGFSAGALAAIGAARRDEARSMRSAAARVRQ
jgi:hypothetical protein